MWGTLPYITRQGLQTLLRDLPSKEAPGRDGQPMSSVVCSARVALTLTPTKVVRESLDHLSNSMDKHTLRSMVSKYRSLPEAYDGSDEPAKP